MRYMLINHVEEGGWEQLSAEQQAQGLAAYAAFTDALTAAGALKSSGRLQPSGTAKTVRLVGGKPKVMDGPFAESKEVFGGYFVVEAEDEAAAVAWAARCPAAGHGAVEVRALLYGG